ncbi:MAG TPA: DUF202 domain-containing protein [Puia sp.]|nr:DUF202 domain-containing protein [Puia sp.]
MKDKDEKISSNVSEHLANERTFLAWVRTGIGIMAFGFVVVKFSIFLKQVGYVLNKQLSPAGKGYSAAIGILLVAVGGVTTILAYFRYKKAERQISRNEFQNSSLIIKLLTGFIFLMCALLIAYLIISL